MDAFLDFLRFIFLSLCTIVVTIVVVFWLMVSVETLYYTKQNNALLRELCVENDLNTDSLINTTQNDILNSIINLKEE